MSYVDNTGPTWLDVAVAFPAILVAVTLQETFAPTSVAVKTNVFAVAFAEIETLFASH
jgi:hypothetical protein